MRLPVLKEQGRVFGALRNRDYRLYWIGQVVAVSGFQMANVTWSWLIWELTRSEVMLGMVGLMEAIPTISLSLFGGAIADKVELRRLLVFSEAAIAIIVLLLAILAATGLIQVWHVFAAVFAIGLVEAFDAPGRQALFPHLLDRRDLMNAVSLNSTIWPGTRIFGPALAGLVISLVGEVTGKPLLGAAAAFLLASVGFGVFALFLSLVRVRPIERIQGNNVIRDIVDGIKYVWGFRLFSFIIIMTFANSFLAGSYIALLPVFASEIFKGGASTLGLLFAAGGVGSVVGALIAAGLANFRWRGWLMIGGTVIQVVFLVLFGFSGSIGVALLLLFLSEVGFSLFSVSSQSTLQSLVPDEFRGRVMAMWGLTWTAVLPLGKMQMGVMASFSRTRMADLLGRFAGAPFAVATGASLMLAFTLVGAVPSRRIRTLGAQERLA